jgi:hypothetical protein
MRNGGSPHAARSAFHSTSAASIARPQASALAASCGPGRGVPKVAITLSPMNLSSVPPCANTQSAIRPWNPRSMAITASGVMRSHRAVKPTMSTNRTATSWVRTGPNGSSTAARSSTRLAETWRARLARARSSRAWV